MRSTAMSSTNAEKGKSAMSNQPDAMYTDQAIFNIRKLAALDMVFHRPRLILVEFALGVFGSLALAFVIAAPGFFAGHLSLEQVLVSSYILGIALNYVP